MQTIKSSEVIMKRIRNANLKQIDNKFENVDLEKDIYTSLDDDLEFTFAKELNANGGTFVFCANEQELISNLSTLANERMWDSYFVKDSTIKSILERNGLNINSSESKFLTSKNGITACEALVSRLGSVLVSSKQMSGRRINFFPDTHIVIANLSQLVTNVKGGLELVNEKYEGKFPSMTTLVTGPSRTADIEKTLVKGMHGPRELFVFLLENPLN